MADRKSHRTDQTHRIIAHDGAPGGFAFVYLVREVGSEQLFAVKRLLVNDDEDFAKVKEEIEFMVRQTRE